MATPKKNSAVLVVRSRDTVALPPCFIGAFPKLIEPDTYDPDKPTFKVNGHFTPEGIAALESLIQTDCIDRHFDKMVKDAKEAGLPCVTSKDGAQTPQEFLEGKLKDPHEKAKKQLPVLQVAVKQKFKDKEGKEQLRTIKFWDAKNNLIDGGKLKMGSDTVIQIIVHANLFLSKQNGKDPRPQLQLVGIRVMKYVPYGRGETPPDSADEAAMRAIMGDDYDATDDMAAFALGAASGADAPPVDDDAADDADSPF